MMWQYLLLLFFSPFSQGFSIYKQPYHVLPEQTKYDLQWYVIGQTSDFETNIPKKATIWNKSYVVWKNEAGQFKALDDVCSHRGASLSGGSITNNCATCPYHGYEFSDKGLLTKVPGIDFDKDRMIASAHVDSYRAVEKNGWIWLNTYLCKESDIVTNIFEETNEIASLASCVFLNMDFNCYSRVVSENSLDVMHIGFVHTFGNRKRPAPKELKPPHEIAPYHWKTSYAYEAGENSMAYQYFGNREMVIENEFYLPHTTVARVIFGDFVSTVITFALPISETKTRLFVKTYRNFWKNPIGDKLTESMMHQTMLQDKAVVENIDPQMVDGRFNMRFDKLQNTYKTFYKRFIHPKN
uniref:Rieske domain-containing protein n=1 Tax=viral metagenome TaxID=1070528 RepID=A0A6C0I498_9ZZZZ